MSSYKNETPHHGLTWGVYHLMSNTFALIISLLLTVLAPFFSSKLIAFYSPFESEKSAAVFSYILAFGFSFAILFLSLHYSAAKKPPAPREGEEKKPDRKRILKGYLITIIVVEFLLHLGAFTMKDSEGGLYKLGLAACIPLIQMAFASAVRIPDIEAILRRADDALRIEQLEALLEGQKTQYATLNRQHLQLTQQYAELTKNPPIPTDCIRLPDGLRLAWIPGDDGEEGRWALVDKPGRRGSNVGEIKRDDFLPEGRGGARPALRSGTDDESASADDDEPASGKSAY